MRIPCLTLVLATALPAAALAVEPNPTDPEAAAEYQHCIDLARTLPDEGWKEATAWASLAGGEPAHHCAAVAMIGMRQFSDAATRLEELAANSSADARLRAGMLAQAGQAWLLAKQPDNAYRAQSKALELVPGAPDLLVDRAQAQAEQQNYAGALADLDAALKSQGDRVDALIFRATAKRYLGDAPGARTDLDRALALDDHAQDGWLEDGIEKRLAGDDAGARAAWQRVMTLAPQSDAASMARRNLDLLQQDSAGR